MDKKINSIYRFAPSPTGFLHVGGARTAIFNWLLAQKDGGKFLLRIEDTDRKRSTKESIEKILKGLDWLGIAWNEVPVYQSKRQERHFQIAEKLLEQGKSYRCFCTPEMLHEERRKAEKNKTAFLYDGRCKKLTAAEVESNLKDDKSFALRLKVHKGQTIFNDLVRGEVCVNHTELDDFVILRSNKTPIYHLAVVIDDHDMGVTHVFRGDDHLSNTPKQILLYEALSWDAPVFAHLPLIHGFDGSRLSKRHGATSIEEFRESGYLPEALFNYLCLLGWAPGDDRELMSRQEIISIFSPKRINKKNAVFDEKKLKWMNGKYLSQKNSDQIISFINPLLSDTEQNTIDKNKDSFEQLINLVKTRAQTVPEVYESVKFYFSDPDKYEQQGIDKYYKNENALQLLEHIEKTLKEEPQFNVENLEKSIRDLADSLDIKAGVIIHPLRLALTGKTVSPGIFDVLQILGKEAVLRRIENAIRYVSLLND